VGSYRKGQHAYAAITFAVVHILTLFSLCAPAFGQGAVGEHPGNLQIRFGPPSSTARFSTAMGIITAKCVSCHKVGGSATDFLRFLSNEYGWVDSNFVVPGDSRASLLYKYLQGSGFKPAPLGTMPLGGTFSSSELATLRAWIDQMSPEPPQPTPTATPPAQGGVRLPSQNFPRLGDRFFVKSVFDDIFGPAAEVTTNALVVKSVSNFGGSCDPMGQPPATGQGGDTCAQVDISDISASYIPSASTPRAGLTMKVCNVLAFNDATLEYAVKNATQKSDIEYLKTNSIPSADEIISAYNLFYPSKEPPSTAALESLAVLARVVQSPTFPACPAGKAKCYLDPWRYLLLAICYQPDWQVM
jgi:hypothetical protein